MQSCKKLFYYPALITLVALPSYYPSIFPQVEEKKSTLGSSCAHRWVDRSLCMVWYLKEFEVVINGRNFTSLITISAVLAFAAAATGLFLLDVQNNLDVQIFAHC